MRTHIRIPTVNKERIAVEMDPRKLRRDLPALPQAAIDFAYRFVAQAALTNKRQILLSSTEAGQIVQRILIESDQPQVILDHLESLLSRCDTLWSIVIAERVKGWASLHLHLSDAG